YVIIKLVAQFAAAQEVSPQVLLGAINGYLLIGLVLAIAASLINYFFEGSYYWNLHQNYLSPTENFHMYVYYTFITLATVGYGDIIPCNQGAQALAVLIAVSGQLYIAVVIAFLVGKFAGRPHSRI
ncbi:MAG: ion channel, partial [Chlamydiota bacterium]